MTRILTGCLPLLAPGAHVVITARPWRSAGELIDLPSAVLAAGRAAGLVPVERCVALLAGLRDGGLVPRPSFFQQEMVRRARAAGIPQHLIVHEDTLVLAHRLANTRAGSTAAPVTPNLAAEPGHRSSTGPRSRRDPDTPGGPGNSAADLPDDENHPPRPGPDPQAATSTVGGRAA